MSSIYLVCGVPGSGKTWVLNQINVLNVKVIHHDDYLDYSPEKYAMLLVEALKTHDKVVADCPLFISAIIATINDINISIKPIFIIEDAHTIKTRYEQREHRSIPKQHLSRIPTLVKRAQEYKAFMGTSEQVLNKLKEYLSI